MTAIDFIKMLRDDWSALPMAVSNGIARTASNKDIKRWLQQSAVVFNGKRLQPNDAVTFPITELVFFPKGKNKCTLCKENS